MKPVLTATNLNKTLGGRKIIDNLNLQVFQGNIYGFLGKNGQGKTTTIRLMTGLIFPDSGEIKICGNDLRKDFKQAIANVGAIVEAPSFYGYLSGYENLKLMANLLTDVSKGRIDEVLNIVGLHKRAKDKVKTYSLGMKQRLGIANALLGNPRLVILDEPTNGLDPQGIREIKELIIQLAAEKDLTFFISSHMLHDIEQICNRIGIIDDGKLLLEDDLANLKTQGRSLEEIYFEMTGVR